MHLNDRVTRLTKRIGGMFAALLAAILVAAFGAALVPGVASAAVGDELPIQFSADNATWGDKGKIVWNTAQPSPGPAGEVGTTFYVKNNSANAGNFEAYLGNWSITDNASATFRADLGSTRGSTKTVQANSGLAPGFLLAQAPLAAGQTLKVQLVVGIPAGEVKQGFTINPGWSLSLPQTDGAVIPAPGAPTGITVSPNPATVSAPMTISGTAAPGSTVFVSAGAEDCTATANATTGTFSCVVTPTTTGNTSVTAAAQLPGSAVGQASAPIVVNVKPADVIPTAPAAPTGVQVNPAAATVGQDVTISGKATPGTTVTVQVGTEVCAPVAVDNAGDFSCTFKTTKAGTVQVTAKATLSGLTSDASAPATLVVNEAVDPGTPETGSLGSMGSLGSVDIFGSLGLKPASAPFGAPVAVDFAGSLNAPVLTAQ